MTANIPRGIPTPAPTVVTLLLVLGQDVVKGRTVAVEDETADEVGEVVAVNEVEEDVDADEAVSNLIASPGTILRVVPVVVLQVVSEPFPHHQKVGP